MTGIIFASITNMHIVIAIPTFNRFEYLKKNISIILKQNLNSKIKLSICISNTASTDSTEEYLNSLYKDNKNIFIINKQINNEYENLGNLASIIPNNADWVWYMGDDDMLINNNAILKVVDLIYKKEIDFIHVSQFRRSDSSDSLIYDSVGNLCNKIGYTEILGWISSLLMRRNFFVEGLINTQKKMFNFPQNYSAFNHSLHFYQLLHDKKGVFFDSGLVDPQDIRQTNDSISRWANEKVPERYLRLMDDFIELKNTNLLPFKVKDIFFRYQNINLWDRWIIYLLNETIRSDVPLENKLEKDFLIKINHFWEKMILFTDLISSNNTKKYLQNIIKTSMGLSIKYLFDHDHRQAYETFMIDQCNLLKQSCYDFKTVIF